MPFPRDDETCGIGGRIENNSLHRTAQGVVFPMLGWFFFEKPSSTIHPLCKYFVERSGISCDSIDTETEKQRKHYVPRYKHQASPPPARHDAGNFSRIPRHHLACRIPMGVRAHLPGISQISLLCSLHRNDGTSQKRCLIPHSKNPLEDHTIFKRILIEIFGRL